jgi:hypothetical protein
MAKANIREMQTLCDEVRADLVREGWSVLLDPAMAVVVGNKRGVVVFAALGRTQEQADHMAGDDYKTNIRWVGVRCLQDLRDELGKTAVSVVMAA